MTRRNVLFLQLEVFANCAPHIGMCLFINDLRRKGIDCTTYVVHYEHFHEVLAVIDEGNFDLICLDSTSTIELVHTLTSEFPQIPVLVGGVNAIAILLHTDVSFAVFGPGRRAASEFMVQFFGDNDFNKVTNLFFKQGERIHYSGQTQHWELPSELFPYDPHMEWRYLGPERKPDANTESVSIIAGTGCPYSRSTESAVNYDIAETIRLIGYDLTETALMRLEEIFNRKAHGCSFCIFQLQEHTSYSTSKTIDMLLKQAEHLHRTYDTRAFPIQTENPFPFLNRFLRTLLERGIPLEFVSIRTRPDTLVRHKAKLARTLDLAKEQDFHLSIEEVGFESFVEDELLLFNKGVGVKANMEALELLCDMKKLYPDEVSVHVGHGMILFHPWTTLESLADNLQVMAQYPEVFSRFYAADLTLYSEFVPIFPKLAADGLVVEADYSYGWDYTPKDPLASKAFELYGILFSHFGPDIDITVFIKALSFLENHSIDDILANQFHLAPV